MATKPIAAKAKSGVVAQPPQVFYRINNLLYTLRAIAQREDQLCILMHHLRTSGRLNASLAEELREILDEIPTAEYFHDLDALRGALDVAAPAPADRARSNRARPSPRRKVA